LERIRGLGDVTRLIDCISSLICWDPFSINNRLWTSNDLVGVVDHHRPHNLIDLAILINVVEYLKLDHAILSLFSKNSIYLERNVLLNHL
jgi:hypothetical protein